MDRQREARQDQFMRYRRLIEAKDDEVDDDAEMASEGSNAIEQPLDLTTTSARTRDIGRKKWVYLGGGSCYLTKSILLDKKKNLLIYFSLKHANSIKTNL